MFADQLQEALLSERSVGGMDRRAREQFGEKVLINLDAIVRSRAELSRDDKKLVGKAVKATRAFLEVWARRMGLSLGDLAVDRVSRLPGDKHAMRRHATALSGILSRQAEAKYAASLWDNFGSTA